MLKAHNFKVLIQKPKFKPQGSKYIEILIPKAKQKT
jgi:hypothetical protein